VTFEAERSGDYHIVDYRTLTVGSPVGSSLVIVCPRCGKAGVQVRETRAVAHRVLYRRSQATSGKEQFKLVTVCKTALEKPAPEKPSNLGFDWCPQEERSK
jgi:hypothetical protein